MKNLALRERLKMLGVMGDASGGVQIDIAVGMRADGVERPMCDHNCTEEHGGYDCPAAFTHKENQGAKRTSMPPGSLMIDRVNFAAMGVGQTVEWFLQRHFDSHCVQFEIQDEDVKEALWIGLLKGKIIINIFGGEPLLYPDIIPLLGALNGRGYTVNLTTTGRKLLEPKFASLFHEVEPAVLALSLDDLTISELRRRSAMTSAQIRDEWSTVRRKHPMRGQAQKALEAVYVLRYYQERGGYSGRLLLNMVLHKGNIDYVREMFEVVEQCSPGTVLNPYPAQAAFYGAHGSFGPHELEKFEHFVDWSIEQSKDPTARIVKRLPHWLLHKAAFDCYRDDPQKMADAVAGWDVWRCYNQFGAGFFVQVGQAPEGETTIPIQQLKGGAALVRHPGGRLGCYWNSRTVTESRQYEGSREVFDYLAHGMKALSDKASDPCRGCRMPRLDSLHLGILEAGIVLDDPALKSRYIELRREHAGF